MSVRSASAMPGPTDTMNGPAAPPPFGYRLLAPDEPSPVLEINRAGASGFLIVVDHASPRIPRRLASLGLPPAELERHIAWDIGSLAVARQMSGALDATLVAQNYSRLVIDCNRDPAVESSIPRSSEWTEIPGNLELAEADRLARRAAIFDPYHAHLRALIDERLAARRPPILIAQHSMTDCYKGVSRPMHAAVLYGRDRRFASHVLSMLRREPALRIAENEPYFVSDQSDFTVPRHAEARGLPYVEIEIRQDLIGDARGQEEWAARITRALRDAAAAFSATA